MGIFVISLKQNKGFFTHPKRILFFVISSFVLTSFFMIEMRDAFAVAGINETINFQGRVANTDGTNVANGNYDFVFRLYKASSGGSAQWTETWNSGTSQVEVTNGIFRVALGTHASLSSLDFNDDSWYLSVEFNGDGEMDPRIQFASVPYALNAKTVSGLTVTNTTGTFTLANGKTFVVNNGLTFSGADSTAFVFPSTGGNVVTEDFAQTLTNKTIGSTGLTFSGATTDITTVSNENFVLSPNGTGRIGFGTTTPSAFFDVAGAASVSGQLALYTTPQIQSTNNQTLIIGGDTTGFINLRPLDGLGTVIVNSTAFEVHSASGFGNATNYTSIDADGDLSFVGTADYLIAAGGKYAFRYAGDEDYGLFFDDGAASYDFRNGSAANVFRISASSGALVSAAYTTNGGLIYSTSTGVFTQLGTGTTGQCLTANTSAAPSWSSCGTGGSSNWVINSGTGIINPINNTLDFLVGGTATSSAKFAVLGVASDSPIASLSASTGFGVSLGYNGVIQTTRNQTLTLGGDSTGNIILSPLNGTGIVTVNGILDAVTGGGSTFVVAANDSPARMKAQADYVADGTADEVQIQAAIDALPSTGGQIQLAQGTYNLSSTVSITANKRIRILGYGAILRPAASTTAITVNQGISNAQGAIIEGVTINGQNNSGTTGILLEDTNNPAVYNVRITNVSIGIHINSEETNEFVEGLAIEDVLIRDCVAGGTGISMTTNDGTGSFAQHQWRTVKIANCDTGINLAYPSQFYRSYIENATIWIGENQNGIVIDGDVLLSRMEINVEAATGSSGHTAITIGSNATNTEHLDFYYTQTGTVDTILSNSSNKFFTYKKNRNWFTSGSMPALQMYAHGDSQERLGFRTSFAGGGGLLFGPGGATVPDTNLYRAGVDSLKTDDSFTVGSNLIIEFPGGTPAVNTSTEGFQSASIGNLDMHARGSYRIFMDSNTNSSDNLRIFGDGTSKELLRLEESGGKALLSINNFWTSQDIFTASASGATKLRLDSTGNLGLGVLGADTIEGQIHVRAINDGGDATLVLDADRGDDNADKWSIISQASDSDLSFANHTSEVFKISAAGSIYVAGGQSIDTLSNNTLAIGTTNATTLTLGRTGQGITLPGFDCSALGNGGKITTTSGGVLTCSNDTSGSGGSSNWVLNSTDGTLSPINNTLDFLLGGTATDSAKFAVLGVASDSPSASVSASNGTGLSMNSDGGIQSTRNNTLTVGGDTTGDIEFKPGNSSDSLYLGSNGNVGIGANASSTYDLEIQRSTGTIDQSFFLADDPGTSSPFASIGFSAFDSASTPWTEAYDSSSSTIHSMVVDEVNGTIYAGSGSSGVIYRCEISTSCDSGSDWAVAVDTSATYIRSMGIDTTNGIIYAGSATTGIVYRCALSTDCDAGGDWTTSLDSADSDIYSIAFDSANDIMYVGSWDSGGAGDIYRCDTTSLCDDSADWSIVYTTPSVNGVISLEYDSVTAAIYAGEASGGIITRCPVSTDCDDPSEWTPMVGGGGVIYDFTIDTVNEVIYAATSGSGVIYRCVLSTGCDTGGEWNSSYDSPSGTIYSLTFDSVNGILYAGASSNGIIYSCETSSSCDADGDWGTEYDSDQGGIYSLVFDPSQVVVYAGTSSNGVILRHLESFSGTKTLYAQIQSLAAATGDGLETGSLIFNTSVNGGSSEIMRLMNGMVGINNNAPASTLHITRPLTLPVTGKALAVFDQIENQDIIAASASGTHVFKVARDGSIESTGHMALGSSSSLSSTNILNIIETYSGTSDFTGINTQITKSTATGEFYGIVANPIYTGSGNNSASNFIGVNSVPFYAGSGNMVNSIGIYSQAASIQTGSSGVIGSAYGLYVGDPSAIGGTGTITDNIGIYVAPMTRGVTSDVGIGVDAAQTQTLWLDAHGSSTTSNAGIAFGSARDTLLYRSGSNTLTTGYLQLARLIFPSVSSFDGSIDTISAYILGDITTSARGDIRFVIDSNNNSTNMFRILANSNSNEIVNINESGSIFTAAGTVHDTLTAGTLGIGTTTATTITIGRSGQGITLPGFTGGGTGCTTLTTNGSGVLTCGTAVNQTPWTSDIDADNFSLLDLGTNITSRNGLTLGTGSGGNLTLTPNGTGDVIVSGDGDTNFQVNFSAPPTTNMAVISNSGQGTTTNGVNGLVVDFTQGDDGDATDGNVALLVDVTSSSGDSDALIGLFIDSITGGAAEEIALVIGQGWDAGLIISSGGATNSGLVYSGDGRPTKTITLSPEYSGAVLTDYYGAGTDTNITGAMTSDADTTQGTSIRNYYQWERTTDSTQHFYTVAVRVTLPADFDDWTTSNAVRVSYITESATNTVSDVDVRIYNENDSTIVASDLDNASTSWATVDFAGSTLNDDSSSEWDAAGETAVIYLRMGSASSNYVRVGDIQLNYLAKF